VGRSTVNFTNSYGQRIYAAYMRLDHACGDECGDPWDVLGWVRLEPGETKSRQNPTSNRWFYYYGEAVDGAFWAGSVTAEVTGSAFEKCTCLGVIVQNGNGSPYYDVGFRSLDTNNFSGVNFTP
jgi:hypothetical protein